MAWGPGAFPSNNPFHKRICSSVRFKAFASTLERDFSIGLVLGVKLRRCFTLLKPSFGRIKVDAHVRPPFAQAPFAKPPR